MCRWIYEVQGQVSVLISRVVKTQMREKDFTELILFGSDALDWDEVSICSWTEIEV